MQQFEWQQTSFLHEVHEWLFTSRWIAHGFEDFNYNLKLKLQELEILRVPGVYNKPFSCSSFLADFSLRSSPLCLPAMCWLCRSLSRRIPVFPLKTRPKIPHSSMCCVLPPRLPSSCTMRRSHTWIKVRRNIVHSTQRNEVYCGRCTLSCCFYFTMSLALKLLINTMLLDVVCLCLVGSRIDINMYHNNLWHISIITAKLDLCSACPVTVQVVFF